MSLFLTTILVPFMIVVNTWGTTQFKSSQFIQSSSNFKPNDPHDANLLCKLDTYYQMLGIVYMLAIFCEVLVFVLLFCMFIAQMKRFFKITDDVLWSEQRRLPRTQGGRCHTLANRKLNDLMVAYEYAYLMMSYGGISSAAEMQFLVDFKLRMQG